MKADYFRIMCTLFFIGILSCNQKPEPDYRESLSAVVEVEIPDSAKINTPVPIKLVIWGSSSCSEYSRFGSQSNLNTTAFTIYQKTDANLICTSKPIEINLTIREKFNHTGVNYLKFHSVFGNFFIKPIFITS